MTFVVSHAEALVRYRAIYAGAHRVTGLRLPEERIVLANSGGATGRAREFLFRRFGIAGKFSERVGAHRPALVHAHFGLSGPAGLTLAESMAVPLVVTYHGQDATITDDEASKSWRGREYLRGRRRVIDKAGLVIAVSEFIRSKLLGKGYPADRVVTHRNGIDLSFFKGDADREPVAVFVGRLVEKKGCEFLLRALGQLHGRGVPVRTMILGDGPLRTSLERLAKELRVNAEFLGFRPLEEVRNWIGRAEMVVVPSVTAADGDSEGLPTVILEAQASSTPVITTRHAGNAEGVLEGRTALLVDERDVEGLAQSIATLHGNANAVRAMGAAGRQFVSEKFDLATQVRGLETLYDQVRRVSPR